MSKVMQRLFKAGMAGPDVTRGRHERGGREFMECAVLPLCRTSKQGFHRALPVPRDPRRERGPAVESTPTPPLCAR
ncbi:hypothetical protein, partial [Ideonella azotifigens]|uniref:hypothetical protein n=1 Tax=Ideonella azotifigens TaxID=513160 RepID=UPI001B867387